MGCEDRTGRFGRWRERGGSGMRGNRRSDKANFTSTLPVLPDTDQHVHILKLQCIF